MLEKTRWNLERIEKDEQGGELSRWERTNKNTSDLGKRWVTTLNFHEKIPNQMFLSYLD